MVEFLVGVMKIGLVWRCNGVDGGGSGIRRVEDELKENLLDLDGGDGGGQLEDQNENWGDDGW
ncbi:hypothetical protein, partial [Bacillus altitudinis]|uniref:hypothetical protein n=1 Tax=Bacillus altitudinis TaxID=293387 RepID=UPI001C92F919